MVTTASAIMMIGLTDIVTIPETLQILIMFLSMTIVLTMVKFFLCDGVVK